MPSGVDCQSLFIARDIGIERLCAEDLSLPKCAGKTPFDCSDHFVKLPKRTGVFFCSRWSLFFQILETPKHLF